MTKTRKLGVLALVFFLGAVVYLESPWTIVGLFIPVAIIYIAFSRLARTNARLEEALEKLEALQGRIVSTSKLASVGAISLDLAHQIKNPLAIIMGRLESLPDQLDQGSRARRHVDAAISAACRMQELTENFMSIGRLKPVQLDIGTVLNDALVMAGLPNRKKIDARWSYPKDLPKVEGNPVLIREAFSNIFANAMEAVEEGGVVTIEAGQVAGRVVVEISDNGMGISDEKKAHLFEPFYSTKPNGHGLGLFAVKHIVEMHQGSVEMETKEGEGTRVTVSLPTIGFQYEAQGDCNGILP